MTEINAAVRKGARLLDDVAPTWRDMINVSRLQMSNTTRCVLGMVFGTYDDGIEALADSQERTDVEVFAIEHGFDVDPDSRTINSDYSALDAQWRGHVDHA